MPHQRREPGHVCALAGAHHRLSRARRKRGARGYVGIHGLRDSAVLRFAGGQADYVWQRPRRSHPAHAAGAQHVYRGGNLHFDSTATTDSRRPRFSGGAIRHQLYQTVYAGEERAGRLALMQRAWLPALVCVLLGLAWQLLTVHFNYGGDFTALFCTGAYLKIPPKLAGQTYVFQGSTGHDGQYYRYVAHDPLFQTEIGRALPNPAIRYRRILLPGLAYVLALGQQRWIDISYFAVNLAFLFLGAWWLAQLLTRIGLNQWFALFYLAVPAVLISLDRLVT